MCSPLYRRGSLCGPRGLWSRREMHVFPSFPSLATRPPTAMLDATGLSVPVLVSLGTIGKWRVAVLGPWVRSAVSATRRVADDPEQPESSSHPEPEPWPSVSRDIQVSMHPRVHVHRNAPDRRQAAWAALSDAVGHTPAARARRSSRLRKPGDPWPLCAPLTGLTPRRGFFV